MPLFEMIGNAEKTYGTFPAVCGIKCYAIICKNGILSLTLYKKEKAIFTKLMACRFYTTYRYWDYKVFSAYCVFRSNSVR
jgi:hypothetical protein